jgi:hypothetical protein
MNARYWPCFSVKRVFMAVKIVAAFDSVQVSASQTNFAMTVGGGFDVKVAKHFALRPFAVDYMLTTFPSLIDRAGDHQNGLRLSAGVLFQFGGEH